MTQLESERWPARFCQTPMWEFSVSSRRHVIDGDGALLHFRSLAWRISDKPFVEDGVVMLLSFSNSGAAVSLIGKLVFAFLPLINTAA